VLLQGGRKRPLCRLVRSAAPCRFALGADPDQPARNPGQHEARRRLTQRRRAASGSTGGRAGAGPGGAPTRVALGSDHAAIATRSGSPPESAGRCEHRESPQRPAYRMRTRSNRRVAHRAGSAPSDRQVSATGLYVAPPPARR